MLTSTFSPESITNIEDNREAAPLPNCDALKELFTPPQDLPETIRSEKGVAVPRADLNKAGEEIVSCLINPIRAADRTISQLIGIEEDIRNLHVKEREQARQSLEFLNNFLTNPGKEVPLSVEALSKWEDGPQSSYTGLRLILRNQDEDKNLGNIGKLPVTGVEISFKYPTKDSDSPEDRYTMYAISFRFSTTGGKEITSFRVDLHNRDLKEVQVDADYGSPLIKKTHTRVNALSGSNELETETRMRLIQDIVMVQLTEKLVENERVNFTGKHDKSKKLLLKARKASRSELGLHISEESEQNSVEILENPVSEAFGAVNPKIIEGIRKSFSKQALEQANKMKRTQEEIKLEQQDISGLTSPDILALWLFDVNNYKHLQKNSIRDIEKALNELNKKSSAQDNLEINLLEDACVIYRGIKESKLPLEDLSKQTSIENPHLNAVLLLQNPENPLNEDDLKELMALQGAYTHFHTFLREPL